MNIYYSPAFRKMYKRLPQRLKLAAEEKEKIFRQNPFDTRLDTHKLGGKLRGYWAFSIDYHYRIAFSFVLGGDVRFHAVGTHNIYKRLRRR